VGHPNIVHNIICLRQTIVTMV